MPFVDIQRDPDGIQFLWKHDSEVLDYLYDWAAREHGNWAGDWLQAGEFISNYSIAITPNTGLDVDLVTLMQDQKGVIVYLRNGAGNDSYDVVCSILTNTGREACSTMRIKMRSACGANT